MVTFLAADVDVVDVRVFGEAYRSATYVEAALIDELVMIIEATLRRTADAHGSVGTRRILGHGRGLRARCQKIADYLRYCLGWRTVVEGALPIKQVQALENLFASPHDEAKVGNGA